MTEVVVCGHFWLKRKRKVGRVQWRFHVLASSMGYAIATSSFPLKSNDNIC
uniref:Uncharacterized protein n=1 Tax=Manihot esculenta TaxID=3983 RepID=A0A2C9VCR8_MANES